jgi:multiple sugar transport system ATP-binding protein
MAKVIIEHASKIFRDDKGNDVKAADDVCLEIENQEFMVFVGPSGCGKSTTLRMIAGLEEITSGTIRIDDRVINDVPPKDRDIAMVFQNYALYPHMTVFNNLAFGLKLRKIGQAEIEHRVHEAADILGIRELLQRRPKELSGGQRQRVAVGRAIVRKPKVFLFDEPLSNLDAKMRVQMRTEISKLHTRLSATMIYVTHDQVEAMTMGDRITVMNKGKIQQVASPLVVYNDPKTIFVAGFIGSPAMNFFKGSLVQKDGGVCFSEKCSDNSTGFSVALDQEQLNSQLRNHIGREVSMGLRSEDIQVQATLKSNDPLRTVQAVVEVVEPMGSEVYLYMNSGSHTFTARVPSCQKSQVNHKLELVFDMKRAHFFDLETEEKLV